jgi:hypothetical protein
MKQFTLLLIAFIAVTNVFAQSESKQMVRLAKLVVDPNQLEQYKAILK